MCTVTIVALDDGGIRLGCNRDESRQRPAALPPVIRRFCRRRAAMPIDAVSGGTWIAVSDAPLAMAVLNVNPDRKAAPASVGSLIERITANPPVPARKSRGAVIPALLGSTDLASALKRAMRLDVRDYSPFRLLLADSSCCWELGSDGTRFTSAVSHTLVEPLMFTSSGLGDERVKGPRLALFEKLCSRGFLRLQDCQDAFHRHSWIARRHFSVCMSRPDACTVSWTTVEIRPDSVRLTYFAAPPNIPSQPVSLSLSCKKLVLR